MVSGPSFNCQRVLARRTDLIEESTANAGGSYTYTFPLPIPSSCLAPLNDSASFGSGDGELQGEALLSGTYTVGLEAYKDYEVEEETCRDAGNDTEDFLVGSASALDSYSPISSPQNCDSCHSVVLFHGGGRRGFEACILCHGTAGSEDRAQYTAGSAPATSGATIDFRTMLHKIHMKVRRCDLDRLRALGDLDRRGSHPGRGEGEERDRDGGHRGSHGARK